MRNTSHDGHNRDEAAERSSLAEIVEANRDVIELVADGDDESAAIAQRLLEEAGIEGDRT
jgi:hypothetical protein